jgi:hypothetical protein
MSRNSLRGLEVPYVLQSNLAMSFKWLGTILGPSGYKKPQNNLKQLKPVQNVISFGNNNMYHK